MDTSSNEKLRVARRLRPGEAMKKVARALSLEERFAERLCEVYDRLSRF